MVMPASFERADAIAHENKLPHFFKRKLRLASHRGSKDDLLKTLAEIFAVSTSIARECRYNAEEIHEYTIKSSDAQVRRFPSLIGRPGGMPNPVWRYAESYAHYKTDRKDKKEIERIKKA